MIQISYLCFFYPTNNYTIKLSALEKMAHAHFHLHRVNSNCLLLLKLLISKKMFLFKTEHVCCTIDPPGPDAFT